MPCVFCHTAAGDIISLGAQAAVGHMRNWLSTPLYNIAPTSGELSPRAKTLPSDVDLSSYPNSGCADSGTAEEHKRPMFSPIVTQLLDRYLTNADFCTALKTCLKLEDSQMDQLQTNGNMCVKGSTRRNQRQIGPCSDAAATNKPDLPTPETPNSILSVGEDAKACRATCNEFDASASCGRCVNITCTGFSLGGQLAFALAHRLVTNLGDQVRVRVIALGVPFISSSLFTNWCRTKLSEDSLTFTLAAEASKCDLSRDCTLFHSAISNCAQGEGAQDKSPSHLRAALKPQENQLIFDPICVQDAEKPYTAPPPNTWILVNGRMLKMCRTYWRDMEVQAKRMTLSFGSVCTSLTTRFSIFNKDFETRFNRLHSLVRYYEELAKIHRAA
eukprot:GHVT01026745.1.p1 GENE.GHVT01026745.1~~GHVT01026745.1.p1  ORF type:complete len:387 (+),score=13.26 GHVT01026745.1:453-1613(+)